MREVAGDLAGRFTVERVLFEDPEKGFAVVEAGAGGTTVTAAGRLFGVRPGGTYRLYGTWEDHPRYGRRLRVEAAVPELPTTGEGVARFLASCVPGIGTGIAARLASHLGPRALEIVEKDPGRLLEVPGIGPGRARAIVETVQSYRETAEVLVALHDMGCAPGLAVKLVARYGRDAARFAAHDPYRICREVRGVGFATADRLALSCGVGRESPGRIEAGIAHVLREAVEQGHCALPMGELATRASALLGVGKGVVRPAVERLAADGRAVLEREGGLVFPREMWEREASAARHVARLLRTRRAFREGEASFPSLNVSLSPEQLEAVRAALEGGVVVITGNPGTGKTVALRAIADVLRRRGVKTAAACPTGRAAQRLEELSGFPAMTIHRLLGYSPREGFAFGEGRPLPMEAVLVDEASMVDLPLFGRLVEALPDGCALVLVGDADQLPPVGPGDVLRSLVRSGVVPHVRLTRIFRQAQGSLIVRNAHRIVRGLFPLLPQERGEEVLFIKAEDPEEQVGAVVHAVTGIAAEHGYDPREVPVFCPMYRGPNGIDRLNDALREAINPRVGKPELRRGRHLFRLGDRVLQTANNYEKGVMNGDLGIISAINVEERSVEVAFPGEAIRYGREDLGEISPAWAISVHKAQGGEYPAAVVLLDSRHYVLLTRNLLYTALTRARNLCIVVGSRRAIAIALQNNRPSTRHTSLEARLREACVAAGEVEA